VADLQSQVREVARDLMNLEVNTIQKPCITGQKMPPPRHALIDIGKDYYAKLIALGANMAGIDQDRLGSFAAFDAFRKAAKDRTTALQQREVAVLPEDEANLLMLDRIRDLSDQIKGMMNGWQSRNPQGSDNPYSRDEIESGIESRPVPELNVTPKDLLLIRKVWELGTEEIAMQTVIQLDGDVFTRIAPKYVRAVHETLHKIHGDGVRTSVSFWNELIGIVSNLLDSFTRSIVNRR
jgi:hypothetical protein